MQTNSSNQMTGSVARRDCLLLLSTNNGMSQKKKIQKHLAVTRRSTVNQLISISAAKEKHPLTHLFTSVFTHLF